MLICRGAAILVAGCEAVTASSYRRPKAEQCDWRFELTTKRDHADIRWHPELQEWFCAICGRTSDHTKLDDAQNEMNNFECELPSVEKLRRHTGCILNLRIVKWDGTVPALGECTFCSRQFSVPVVPKKIEDAIESITKQFVDHDCAMNVEFRELQSLSSEI